MEEPPEVNRRFKAFRDAVDGAYWSGFDHGMEAGQRVARDELKATIETELIAEMERFDPDCDLCAARRKIAELEKALRALRIDFEDHVTRQAGWRIRDSERGYLPDFGRSDERPPPGL